MSEVPIITATRSMLEDALSTMSISGSFTIYDYTQDLTEDTLPALVISPIESSANYGFLVIGGTILVQVVALADINLSHRENIKNHTELTWELTRNLQLLPFEVGYLVSPKYSITSAERIGESAEVVSNSDILESKITITFGLSEP